MTYIITARQEFHYLEKIFLPAVYMRVPTGVKHFLIQRSSLGKESKVRNALEQTIDLSFYIQIQVQTLACNN